MMKIFKLILVCLSGLSVLLVLACSGGGSVGTGGHKFEGSVVGRLSGPITGAEITVLETSDSGLTDAAGTFAFETTLFSGEAELLIRVEEAEFRVTVVNIPPEPSEIEVEIEIEEDSGIASTPSVKIDPREDIEPSPSEDPDSSDPSISTPSEPSLGGPSSIEPSLSNPGVSEPSSISNEDEPSIDDPGEESNSESSDGPSIVSEPSEISLSDEEPSISEENE